jgi:alginate O-acetyltransferase complex protein AlgI
MLFNSLPFLFGFLPAVYLIFWRLRTRQGRFICLAVTGYLFYSFWDPRFCLLMAFTTLVSYSAGLGFLRWSDPRARKLLLLAPIVVDLALLGYFKYAGFALESANRAGSLLGLDPTLPVLQIVLPIGISFYTFHTITYIVDSYRGVITPTRNLFEFAAYVSLFSQLVAGPIVRFREVQRDLESLQTARRTEHVQLGWSFFAIGLCEKVLIADTIASVINPALKHPESLSTVTAWLCALGYSYQLFFDFSGYSSMAVGLGLLFGITIPQNFHSPYKADSPSDFWRRWHISLSSCLRDYLYIPLGGSRGPRWLTYRNLLLTMLIGGLWHGASWTFVAWGGYHGLLLAAQRAAGERWTSLPTFLRQTVTFLLVVFGWVLFRSDDFTMAGHWLTAMVTWTPGEVVPGAGALLLVGAVAAYLAHVAPNVFQIKHDWSRRQALGLTLAFALCVLLIFRGQPSPFLYFQF